MSDQSRALLLVEIGPHRCAIAGGDVEQVLRACAIAPLHGAPAFVQGAINLHGGPVPVVDLRRRLGLPSRPVDPNEHFVVVNVRGRRLALRVDRAVDLTEVAESEIAPADELAPETVAGALVTPHGLVFIHDVHRFLTEAEQTALSELLRSTS